MSTFLDLQDGWYNGLIQGLGQSKDSFQIIQPAPPIASGTAANPTFWAYYNNIPPKTLTTQFVASGGNQFYNNYRGLLSALEPSRTISVGADIGEENFLAWQAYVQKQPMPNMNQMPTMFRNWAMFYAPDVANIGSSDYAAILLDPIATAQNELTLVYTTDKGLPINFDWQLNYADMVNQLASSPSRSFSFDSSTMDKNVSSSWAGSSTSGFFGLWGGSSSTSTLSEQFASSRIKVDASFEHVLVLSNTPGAWYYSSAMGLAFANQTGSPWRDKAPINWNNTFGKDGNMQYFSANVIVASGMSITVTSDAKYSSLDQQTITSSGSSGFWPFYSGDSGSTSTNRVSFTQDDHMTITTSSIPGVPVVLGVNVLPVGEFVGHSSNLGVSLFESARVFAADSLATV
jgi:hypothetical protein